jgi:hypothetical protein
VQVNKLFHKISLSRHLWISVVRGLCFRRVIDVIPDEVLETLTRDALIEEVKRVVLGPRTWSPRSRSPPTIHRQITVPLMDIHWRLRSELLPGGRFLMCCAAKDDTGSAPQVEFWEMHTGKRVWAWERPGCTVASAEFDLTDRGNEVVVYILFCESVFVFSIHFPDTC